MTIRLMRRSLESILDGFSDPRRDPVALLGEVVDHLRPRRNDDTAAAHALRPLILLLQQRPAWRESMAAALIGLLERTRQVSLYATAGIFPPTGFVHEAARRIGCTLLPEVVDRDQLKDLLGLVFHRPEDGEWMEAADGALWLALLETLFEDGRPISGDTLPVGTGQLVDGLAVLSYHVAAIGLDAELVRVLASLEDYESPFLAPNVEMLAHLRRFTAAWEENGALEEDDRHLRVLLDQCREVMQRIRRRASQEGTSVSLTFKMERLGQNLRRIEEMLDVLEEIRPGRPKAPMLARAVPLFKHLVRSECRKNHLGYYVKRNIELLSLRVTENASRTGEHYITETRSEYLQLVRSAMGAGLIIAFMAGIKLVIAEQHLAPLNEALAACLNYGLGFVLIHLLHFTVATKQPAMTANAIAASIVEAVDPLGGALIYAGIAGACLFLSGLVAGYFDNLAAYDRIPERLLQLPWARRLLGPARLARIADYVGNNLGALAGNFLFGFMLGGVTALGVLFGLPLDIRHIAFSSAHSAYAIASLDFAVGWQTVAVAALGVGLIGVVNLTVSFALALWVALRARQVTFAQGRALIGMVLKALLTRPGAFLWPPRAAPVEKATP